MPTFQRCPGDVQVLADMLLSEFPTHAPILDAEVKIDFVFAFADVNEDGIAINNALTKNGAKALGICKKISLKDRAMGRGDVEIALDGRWRQEASEAEQRAILDHELHHIEVQMEDGGIVKRDDLHRPLIKMRKHDYEFGWFSVIAERHGKASLEVKQAAIIKEKSGQLYWPDIFGPESFGISMAVVETAIARKGLKGRK